MGPAVQIPSACARLLGPPSRGPVRWPRFLCVSCPEPPWAALWLEGGVPAFLKSQRFLQIFLSRGLWRALPPATPLASSGICCRPAVLCEQRARHQPCDAIQSRAAMSRGDSDLGRPMPSPEGKALPGFLKAVSFPPTGLWKLESNLQGTM